MNFHNLNFDYVEQHRPYPQHPAAPRSPSNLSEATLRDPNLDYASSRPASPSPQPTVIPWAPTPPSPSNSTPEFYGPDRLFQSALIPQPQQQHPRQGSLHLPLPPHHIQLATMEGRQDLEGQMNAAMLTGFRDDLAREAGVVTPGVDDTPYIHYAIEALTRDRDTGYSGNETSGSDVAMHIPPVVPSQLLGYDRPPLAQGQWREPLAQEQWQQPLAQEQWQQPLPSVQAPMEPSPVYYQDEYPDDRVHGQPGRVRYYQDEYPDNRAHGQPSRVRHLTPLGFGPGLDESRIPSPWAPRAKPTTVQPHEWMPMERDVIADSISQEKANELFPPLDFLPSLLRPGSFALLLVFSIAMLTILIYCAVHSEMNQGLVAFSGTIYGSQYFVFRMLPQLLAVVILMYAQCVVAAMFRIYPFLRLSSDRSQDRDGAIFQDLHPKWFLWPRLIGGWNVWIPILVTWLLSITVPLQSALFTVILVDGVWMWAAVQGVAWTLVALYVALLVATVIGFSFWARVQKTGLLWDPRSLADIIMMISGTNTAADYQGTQLAGTRDRLRFALRRRGGDKLGYWTWKDGRGGLWYALGNSMDDESSLPFPDTPETHGAKNEPGYDVEASAYQPQARYRYLPWCLRSSPLLFAVVAAFVLVLALFVVSFLPSTHIKSGFLPWLPAGPRQGAFSSADFLYSFLPSLVGLILWQLFQALDLTIRTLQPWAALAEPRGSPAEKSLLADYSACIPILSAFRAAKNGHWRVAAISTLSTLFLLLPVLGGGMFMALTRSDREVRMFPNMPAFALALALLVLYVLALVSMLPGRKSFRLPHAVNCLAEIISFLANRDLLADQAFKKCATKEDMLRQMGLRHGTQETQPRWVFAADSAPRSSAPSTEGMPGVRRARLFTEKKRPIRKSQIRRGGRHGA